MWWGSPLVQEKFRRERPVTGYDDDTTTTTTHNNKNKNSDINNNK
jgi:hypothetical protein